MKAAVPKPEKDKVKVALPNIGDRHQVHIINPKSGRGEGAAVYAAVQKSGQVNMRDISRKSPPRSARKTHLSTSSPTAGTAP